MLRNVTLSLAVALPLMAAPRLSAGPTIPAQLAHARYVALGYDIGTGFVGDWEATNPSQVLPEDRRALSAIRDQLKSWGRYIVTNGSRAELFLVVRTGRLASIGGGGRIGRGRGATLSGGSGFGEISSRDDTLSVYDGVGGPLLWRGTRADGLSGSSSPLLDEFRADVEKVAAKPKP